MLYDEVLIPQRRRLGSYAQVPAKIFDAMAMAKPIISTKISDIPEILDNCGWVVEPENPRQLAETIQYVFDHSVEAKEKGKKREKNVKADNMPIISIIVPVLNGEKTIGMCLEALLRQSYPSEKYEILVVDNGSYDNTVNIVEEFPVRLLFEKRAQNSYMARNLGIKCAEGEIIVFIDADCIAEKDCLTNLVEPFHDENIGVVAGEVLSLEPKNLIQGFYTFSGFLEQEKKVKNKISAIGAGNTAIRKIIFDIIGQFDGNFRWGGDNDFGVRIQKETNYLIRFAPKAIVYHSHRVSLKGLIKHAYTYGLGKGRFRVKYANQSRIGRNTSILWNISSLLRLFVGIVIMPFHSYKVFRSGRSLSESLTYPILDKLFCIVEQIGIIIFLVRER